jgi:uncharacterized protein
MKIAIIGAGISGNSAAYALSQTTDHSITIYEKEARAGGHSATVTIEYDGENIAVDTGFIVYNEMNYPHLTALFRHLKVPTQASNMSFSVSRGEGAFEWAGRPGAVFSSLFAQKRNLASPTHWCMIYDVLRFNKQARIDYEQGALQGLSLGDYLQQGAYSARFREDYLLPMGAAIWSMAASEILDFPAASFVAFFDNHHLMQMKRPVWRTVTGGSRVYVDALTACFASHIRLNCAATAIIRRGGGVDVTDQSGTVMRYDQVIMATHSDQALALLHDASIEERAILGAVRYRPNDVYLHRDPRFMPKRKAAWASWNVSSWNVNSWNVKNESARSEPVTVTYWMNLLQSIAHDKPLFVSLNPPQTPDHKLVFGRFSYDHPQYDQAAIEAQARLERIQGENHVWFCGAWTGMGFHEDGLRSGLEIAAHLGAKAPWL